MPPHLSTTVDRIGMVESSKAANEIYSPVSGKVQEINKLILSKPRLINSNPMDEGIFYTMDLFINLKN